MAPSQSINSAFTRLMFDELRGLGEGIGNLSQVETVTHTFRKYRRITGIFSRGSMGRSKVVFPRGKAAGGSGISGDSGL
jgi:hypothetical protein